MKSSNTYCLPRSTASVAVLQYRHDTAGAEFVTFSSMSWILGLSVSPNERILPALRHWAGSALARGGILTSRSRVPTRPDPPRDPAAPDRPPGGPLHAPLPIGDHAGEEAAVQDPCARRVGVPPGRAVHRHPRAQAGCPSHCLAVPPRREEAVAEWPSSALRTARTPRPLAIVSACGWRSLEGCRPGRVPSGKRALRLGRRHVLLGQHQA